MVHQLDAKFHCGRYPMRTIALSIFITLAAKGFSSAAPFTCQFNTKTDSPNGFSCKVETTTDWTKETTKCRQDYSDTLFGQCDGLQPGGVDQLICYFANPANPPNLNTKDLINQPGVYATVIEWTGTLPPSAAPMVFEYKDGASRRLVSCMPDQFPTNK
jgi:hypothetical protein